MKNFRNFTSREGRLNRTIFTMEFVTMVAVVLVLCLYLSVFPAWASTVVYDHFDDGALDSAWSITLQDATGWTYSESGTNLTVTGINPTVINYDSGGTYAKVILSQTFTALTDFNVDFDISWDSEGVVQAMQIVRISLYDAGGNPISWAGYGDHWVGHRGQKEAMAGGNENRTGYDTLSYTDSASVDISRISGMIDVSWDGISFIDGFDTTPISGIDIEFWYNAYNGPGGTSFFGTEFVDLVKVQGTPVPLPSTLLLLGSGLMGIIGLGKRTYSRKSNGLLKKKLAAKLA